MSRKKTHRSTQPPRSVRMPMRDVNDVIGPLSNGLLAFMAGTGTEDHYNDIACAFVIAFEIAGLVQRHNHLQPALKEAADGLGAIHRRHAARNQPAARRSGTPDEVTAIENGLQIYKALLIAPPRTLLARAIDRARVTIDNHYEDDAPQAIAA